MNVRFLRCVEALLLAVLSLAQPLAAHLAAQSNTPRIQIVREQVLDGEREDFPVVNGGRASARLDIALTLRQDFQVRVYDANGKRLATIGRRGQAPGEFMSPQVQGWLSDTIWVYDGSLRRHSYFTREGRLLRTVPLETSGRDVRVLHDSASARLADFFPWARREDGTLVGAATIVRNEKSGIRQRESVVSSYSSDGTAIKLANTDHDSRWEAELAVTTAAAVSPNGRNAVVASVSDLTASGSEIVLSRFDERGVLRGTSRVGYRGVPYPADRLNRVLKRGVGPDHNQAVIASRVPKVLPPLNNILVRDDGIVLLTLQKTAETQAAVLIDAQGMTRGEFALPQKADVMATRGSYVWLKERNNDDISSVVRYRLMCGSRECVFQSGR